MNLSGVFGKNIEAFNSGARVIANKGGARSGKTFSLLQLLLLIAIKSPSPLLISVVSESLPHLKKGAIRDFATIIEGENLREGRDYKFNRTDNLYTFGRSKIEFFSADSPGKVHGPQRDILFINEANHIPFEVYRQLAIRTSRTIFIDWNPSAEFWFEEEAIDIRSDTRVIHSTYKDNDFLSPAQVKEIEANKGNENWWRVYGLGLTGTREGLVITNWQAVRADLWPTAFKRTFVGIDFGFTNDPTGILTVSLADGELWCREYAYLKGLTNPEIARLLKDRGLASYEAVADSAEQKSIAEIRAFGLRVEPSIKGPDSVNSGLQILQRYKINIHEESLNLIKELRNYEWQKDRITGKILNQPIDAFNHLIDPMRYVAINKLVAKPKSIKRSVIGRN